MRQNIIDVFWDVYGVETWKRVLELVDENYSEQLGLEAISSIDKFNIIKIWRERLMVMCPKAEQHHIFPFHHRWMQSEFKDRVNIEKNWAEWGESLTQNHLMTEPSESLTDLQTLHPTIFEGPQEAFNITDEVESLDGIEDYQPADKITDEMVY